MKAWQAVVAAIAPAKSCMSENPDSVSYCHLAFIAGPESSFVWFTPAQAANPIERHIIVSYATINAPTMAIAGHRVPALDGLKRALAEAK